MKRYRASIIYVLVFTSLVLIDQTTKIFSINKTMTIIPNILRIIYTKNYGGALGVFNNKIVVAVDISLPALIDWSITVFFFLLLFL